MRLACVGKGGSGKSTITTLFFLHLAKQNQTVVCFDADLNIHVPTLLGIHFPEQKSLSLSENTKKYESTSVDQAQKSKAFPTSTKPHHHQEVLIYLRLKKTILFSKIFLNSINKVIYLSLAPTKQMKLEKAVTIRTFLC